MPKNYQLELEPATRHPSLETNNTHHLFTSTFHRDTINYHDAFHYHDASYYH